MALRLPLPLGRSSLASRKPEPATPPRRLGLLAGPSAASPRGASGRLRGGGRLQLPSAPAGGAYGSVLLRRALGSAHFSTEGKPEIPPKQPLKKAKLPVGRFDEAGESSAEKEPLEKFPDGINPVTKERGGPVGPEPTRYGDWERKGRCIDF